MTRPRAFLSILAIVLTSTVALVLSLIHPTWAVRLTRYVSQSMVGGRRSRRFPGGSRKGRRSPASKVTCHGQSNCNQNDQNNQDALLAMGSVGHHGPKAVPTVKRFHHRGQVQGDLQAVSGNTQGTAQAGGRVIRSEVQSALVNLGMPRPQAKTLAQQAVSSNLDFDSAIRWAVARRAA